MNSGLLRRVIQAVFITLIAALVVGGYLGLRALVWRQNYLIATMIQSGLEVSLMVGAAFGVAYVVMGSLLWRVLNLDWLSLQVGAMVGALLYGGYNALSPLTAFSIGEDPAWRGLQGATDGLLIGLILGALVMIVSGRPLHLDSAGLSRYLILYITLILLAWLILLVESYVHFPDVVSVIAAIPVLLVLRLAVGWLDRREDRRRR